MNRAAVPLAALLALALILLAPTPTLAKDWAVALGADNRPITVEHGSNVRQTALAQCESFTTGCKVIASGNNRCFAVAKSATGWGAAGHFNKRRAGDLALAACEATNTGACTLIQTFC